MTQEEKFEEAKRLYETANADQKYVLESLFPELAGSDGERIRKRLLKIFREAQPTDNWGGLSTKDIIAWLEKQGEHKKFRDSIQVGDKVTRNRDGVLVNLSQLKRVAKPADKIEPKFHKGEWVVNNTTFNSCHVLKVEHGQYVCDDCSFPITKENEYHLWTIQDAKDGDVLAVDNMIFIYERTLASHIVSYCKLINDIFEPVNDARTCCEGNPYVHPATKEQRDTLMKAMANAGYTFDFNKKELKKIEQKPAWSEEDERMCNSSIRACQYMVEHFENSTKDYEDSIDWLKSIKDRYTWKPSEKQIMSLYNSIPNAAFCERETLTQLYVDLKKLREE